MMPKVLWETTLNPRTRRLLRVEIADQIVTDRVINELMGKDASARFRFIMDARKRPRNWTSRRGGAVSLTSTRLDRGPVRDGAVPLRLDAEAAAFGAVIVAGLLLLQYAHRRQAVHPHLGGGLAADRPGDAADRARLRQSALAAATRSACRSCSASAPRRSFSGAPICIGRRACSIARHAEGARRRRARGSC